MRQNPSPKWCLCWSRCPTSWKKIKRRQLNWPTKKGMDILGNLGRWKERGILKKTYIYMPLWYHMKSSIKHTHTHTHPPPFNYCSKEWTFPFSNSLMSSSGPTCQTCRRSTSECRTPRPSLTSSGAANVGCPKRSGSSPAPKNVRWQVISGPKIVPPVYVSLCLGPHFRISGTFRSQSSSF